MVLDGPYDPTDHLADGATVFADAWCRGWEIPPQMTVSEWADAHRIISRKAGSEPGQWRTDRFPYLREIMDCFSAHSDVREVDLMKSTQVGGTEVLNNVAGYVIAHAPGPMMVLMPTLGLAELWSKQRFAPMLEEMPCFADKVAPSRARDSDNTTLLKGFRGGVLSITGANSSSGLRSMPVKILLADEVDEYDDDLNSQGSALELAERRTSTFARRKIGRVSTPTVKGNSKIETGFLAGDQRRYHVPCPVCAHEQVLRIENLGEDGEFRCVNKACNAAIAEHHKTAMLAAGRWVATADCADAAHRSYHIWAAYSPIGVGYSWCEIARMREAAKRDPDLEVTFANTILGETYDSATMRVEADEIARRAEGSGYKLGTIPPGALLLTAGVDVQANRFELSVYGWGRGERCWLIDTVALPADPTRIEDYDMLDGVIARAFVNRHGMSMRVSMLAIDSGNWTHEVYAYVRRTPHAVMAVKGLSTGGKQIIHRFSEQDVRSNGRVIRNGVRLWPIGTDTAKNTLVGRLVADSERERDKRYFAFAEDTPEDYFEQITAEKFDERRKRWVKTKGRRNEALDCLVYAYAAALHPRIGLHKLRDADWSELEAKLEPHADLFTAAPVGADVPRETKNEVAQTMSSRPPSPPSAEAPGASFASTRWSERL